MALISCPECGKEISSKAKACIHCGCPIEEVEAEKIRCGKLLISNSKGFGTVLLPFEKIAVIVTRDNKVLCSLRPGENKMLEICEDVEIFAANSSVITPKKMAEMDVLHSSDKLIRKSELLKVRAEGTTRLQVSMVAAGLGLGTKVLLNVVDVIDSE